MSLISKILTLLTILLVVLMISSILIFVPIDVPIQEDSAETVNETKLQQLTYDKLNDERSNRGIHRLEQRTDIEEISQYKTQNMIEQDYISHDSPDGEDVRDRFLKFDVDDCRNLGENLAKTFYDRGVNTENSGTITYKSMDELSDGVVQQFIDSPSHKDNLLDEDWESHGLSIQVTSDNEVYVTHKFCN